MDDDDELCLCFHVTRRKVVQFSFVKAPPGLTWVGLDVIEGNLVGVLIERHRKSRRLLGRRHTLQAINRAVVDASSHGVGKRLRRRCGHR